VGQRAVPFAVAVFLAGGASTGRLVLPPEPKPGTVFHSFVKPDGPEPFPVDSFTPRGGTACSVPRSFPATLDQVTEDAVAALAWLRGHLGRAAR
jgi:hypothetical protein